MSSLECKQSYTHYEQRMDKVFKRLDGEKLVKDDVILYSRHEQKEKDEDSLESLRQREGNLPIGLTNISKIIAIEQDKHGWYLHKARVKWEEVLQELGRLYPENTYVLDHGCILMENGIDVACHCVIYYNEKLKTVKESKPQADENEKCWNTHISVKRNKSRSIGVGHDCDLSHKGSKFIQHPSLVYPFYVFHSIFGDSYRTLDGHILRFEKENMSYVIYRDDELIHTNYSPNETELFEMKYPGPYKHIWIQLTWGITNHNYLSIFTDDHGDCFANPDELIYDSFPGSTGVTVQESRYEEAIEKLNTFINHYKTTKMTEERKKRYEKSGKKWWE